MAELVSIETTQTVTAEVDRTELARRVGANVARYRRRSGLSQRELGLAVGVSAQAVSRYEACARLRPGEHFTAHGAYSPNLVQLLRIAGALGRALGEEVTINDLLAEPTEGGGEDE